MEFLYVLNEKKNDLWRWLRDTLYPEKLALTSPTSGGRLVGIVRSRTQAMEFIRSFDRMVNNAQNCDNYINISSSQTYWVYTEITHLIHGR
jgi:hypothetical protein